MYKERIKKIKGEEIMIDCHFCKRRICKYRLDVGDTIRIINSSRTELFICDKCVKKIVLQLLER